MVDLNSQYQRLKESIDLEIQGVLDSSNFINGIQVTSFAKDLARYNNCGFVQTCANGTDALQIAMMTLGYKPGDEVIVPSFTYIATVEVIALLGLRPVFVDADPNTFNIDVKKIEEVITKKTIGIVPVHLYGQCANMEEIMKISKKHGISIIEDTAQAIGAEYTFENGNVAKAGTMGDIGITSFFPSKNLGCYGDGGAMFTNDELIFNKFRMISTHGQSKKYIHDLIGVNSRLDTIQAAILSVKLKELDDFAKRRNAVATKYDNAFQNIEQIDIPFRSVNSTHVFHQYTIKLHSDDRDHFRNYLLSNSIPSMVYYPIPVHLQKAYKDFGYKKGDFPITEKLCSQIISLPIHTEMVGSHQDYIIETIKTYFK